MPDPAHIAKARALEHLAGDLHALAFDVSEPPTSTRQSDRNVAEGERIAAAVRAVFRGNGA